MARDKQAKAFSKESDELEIKLREEIAELTKANEALRTEFTKRQQAEETLWEAEEKYRLLMDYANEAISVIQKMRSQVQEAIMKRTLGKALITAFAHDLKGPLALISSCAQFSMENSELNPPLQENLKIIYESSQRASNLTRKFLELFEFQMLPFNLVNINELVSKVWHMVQLDTQALQVSFQAQLGKKLPEVLGNTEGLERVFCNLFLNAVQAVSKRGKVLVQTHFLPFENMVEVNVIDDGPGIPEEHRHRVFEPFFTTKEEGTGLGLSICQVIVQQHQGSIRVEGAPERGTKVSVKLPIA